MANLDGTDETFDSRDVIARIEELKAEWSAGTDDEDPDTYVLSEDDWSVGLGTDGAAEMIALLALQTEAEGNIADWPYGETFIREDGFSDYCKELCESVGYISADFPEWIVIDWDETADNMRDDYREFEFFGQTYLAR